MNAQAPPRKHNERALAQRERILIAAQRCFIEHGFHEASMASIAEAAAMSAGLIYRYFDSKDSIILAIIDRQLAEKRRNMAALESPAALAERIMELFVGWQRGDESVMNAALFLEMSAQAARDASISAALAAADRTSSVDFQQWLRRIAAEQGADPDEREIQTRALTLQCFVEGLAIRALREPHFDLGQVQRAVDGLLPRLLWFEK